MLAARDQENLVHAHQTAAAGKPLNQGVRQLQPKTPGNKISKTPFRVPLNDENNPLAFNGNKTNGLKGVGKGNDNVLRTGRKDGKPEKNTLITPVEPKTRAPLGQKTTNVKTTAFQTPAPSFAAKQNLQKTNKKPASLKKHANILVQPETTSEDAEQKDDIDSDVPEPEYAPPAPTPLPDPPMELGYDDTFPQFKGRNFTRGWGQLHAEERDEEGVTLSFRERERELQKILEEEDRRMRQEIEDDAKELEAKVRKEVEYPAIERHVDEMIREGNKRRQQEQAKKSQSETTTAHAKVAARALSSKPQSTVSRALAPTQSSLQKKTKPTFSVLGAKAKPSAAKITNPPSGPHKTPLEATSRNTLGYSKGRNISNKVHLTKESKQEPEPVDQRKISPWAFKTMYGEPPMGSEMWYRLRCGGMFDEEVEGDDEESDYFAKLGFNSPTDEGEELFQLPIPDLKLDD
ncbi:MAG: hypothetical protein Q9227_002180 [Pyrenula ochraceoflavens]